jgi:hypothetical protein
MTWQLKTGIVEKIEVAMARQRHGEHVSAATYADATIENTVFSMRSAPKLHNEDQQLWEWLRWRGPAAIVKDTPIL